MSLKARDIDCLFNKLGMTIRNSKDRLAFFYHSGRLILKTKRSHGSGKISQTILYHIRNQLKVNEDQFLALLNCPLKKDDYIKILKSKGFIES